MPGTWGVAGGHFRWASGVCGVLEDTVDVFWNVPKKTGLYLRRQHLLIMRVSDNGRGQQVLLSLKWK